MTTIRREGITVDLPTGWEGRLYRRSDSVPPPGLSTQPGEYLPLILHAANFALPADAGDYGGGAVETMGRSDILVVLVEFEPGTADRTIFTETGLPVLTPDEFDPNALQRTLPGQSGTQHFLHTVGRAFGLYVVLGSHALRAVLVKEANRLVRGITIAPR